MDKGKGHLVTYSTPKQGEGLTLKGMMQVPSALLEAYVASFGGSRPAAAEYANLPVPRITMAIRGELMYWQDHEAILAACVRRLGKRAVEHHLNGVAAVVATVHPTPTETARLLHEPLTLPAQVDPSSDAIGEVLRDVLAAGTEAQRGLVCPKCGIFKFDTAENYQQTGWRRGFTAWCWDCRKEISRKAIMKAVTASAEAKRQRRQAVAANTPTDKLWCSRCEQVKDVTAFAKSATKKNSVQSWCRACSAEYSSDRSTRKDQESQVQLVVRYEQPVETVSTAVATLDPVPTGFREFAVPPMNMNVEPKFAPAAVPLAERLMALAAEVELLEHQQVATAAMQVETGKLRDQVAALEAENRWLWQQANANDGILREENEKMAVEVARLKQENGILWWRVQQLRNPSAAMPSAKEVQ